MVNTKVKREGLAFWQAQFPHSEYTRAFGLERSGSWIEVEKLALGQAARQGLDLNDRRNPGKVFVSRDVVAVPGDAVGADAYISTLHFLATMTDTTQDVDRVQAVLDRIAAKTPGTHFYDAVDALVSRLNACGMQLEVTGRGYTDNADNNFTTDFEYAVIRDNDWREDFIVIERPNGPQLFRLADSDYFWSWLVDFYCEAYEAQFDHEWDFDKGGWKGEYLTRFTVDEAGDIVAQARKGNDAWQEVHFHSPAGGF